MSDILRRVTLLVLALAAFAFLLWPSRVLARAVLIQLGSPPYEGAWVLFQHAFLNSALGALFCLLVWLAAARARWLAPPSLMMRAGVLRWGLLGGVITAGFTIGFLFLVSPSALHEPHVDPWIMSANVVSNFYEELIFRGFLLSALTAALGFWPAAFASSLAFGLVHEQYGLEQQLIIAMFGLLWCWVGRRAGSLLAPYVSHMTLDWLVDPLTL